MTGGAPSRPRALVVDDEAPLVDLVRWYLEREGFEVEGANDGERAVELARCFDPDVIVLDLMLPGMDGLEACRRIRSFSDAYIVMLTARTDELDKIVGLATGADDYVTKPFSPRELVARVRAMLRRPRVGAATRVLRFGHVEIDAAAREVTIDGEPVSLTRLEFDLLATLAAQPRLVFSRRQLIDHIWGDDWFGDEHVVDVHIAKLRRKLGDHCDLVTTIRGVGFRIGGRQ